MSRSSPDASTDTLTRHLTEIYESIAKPGMDPLQSLVNLELIIAHPSELYQKVLKDHFSPGKGLSAELLKDENLSTADRTLHEKSDSILIYQKYNHLLNQLLKQGMNGRHIAELLLFNPNFYRKVTREIGGDAAVSLDILVESLRMSGHISDTEIANLALATSCAKPSLATAEPSSAETGSGSSAALRHAEAVSRSIEGSEEIYNKYLVEQTSAVTKNFSILRLLSYFPESSFREKIIALILSPTTLTQARSPAHSQAFLSLLLHLLPLNVSAEKILSALQSKDRGGKDFITSPLFSPSYQENMTLKEKFHFLKILALKDPSLSTKILTWFGSITPSLESKLIAIADQHIESDGDDPIKFVSVLNTYLELLEQLDPSAKESRKKLIYIILVTRAQNLSQYNRFTVHLLTDHKLLVKTLDRFTNFSNRLGSYTLAKHDLALVALVVLSKIVTKAALSFTEIFTVLKKIHEHETIGFYLNWDITLLSYISIGLLRKEPSATNARKIYDMLSSQNMEKFKHLVYGVPLSFNKYQPTSIQHIDQLFNLLNLLKEQGISDTEIQKLASSFSYHIHFTGEEYPSQFSIANTVNVLRVNNKRTVELAFKMLSQNHLSDSLINTLASYADKQDIATHIEGLPTEERYKASLKVIIGDGSLAKYFESNASLRRKKQDLIAFVKEQAAHLLNDITERKFNDSELTKLASFKESLASHIQSTITNEDERFALSLQAHDASTALGRYFSLITHGSSDAIASKKISSETLAMVLKANIAKVYVLLLSDTLSESQRKGLAFLKEEVAAYMKTLAEPQSFNDHVDAISEYTPLGQFFYQARDESFLGRATGLSRTDPSKGVLKNIVDELKGEKYGAARIISYIMGDAVRVDQLASLARFEEDLAKHWGETLEGEDFWTLYKSALNHETAIGKYFVAANSFAPVSSASSAMRNLNHQLARKVNLFLEKIESAEIKRDSFAPKLLRELQDEFLKAMQRLPNDQCKLTLTQALDPEKKLQAFLSDRQKDLRDLQEKRSVVRGSTAAAGLFATHASAASGATHDDTSARAGFGAPRLGLIDNDDL